MKISGYTLTLWSIFVMFISGAHAQVFTTVDGGNEIRVVDGWINDVSGSGLYIGKNTSGNALHLFNGGRIYDSGAYIGYGWNTPTVNNLAWVAGSGSVWSNSYSFTVGYFSNGNQLLVELDGRVFVSSSCDIGIYSQNNSITIKDAGSFMEASMVIVGSRGNKNTLSVLGGGRLLVDAYAVIGDNSYSNKCVISGVGSKLLMSGETSSLDVGSTSTSLGSAENTFLIEDGGEVICFKGMVGDGFGSSGVNNNIMTVSGSNSVWTVSGSLYVGFNYATGNRLLIENGARVNSTDAYISVGQTRTTNNHVRVTGEGSEWINSETIFIGIESGIESEVASGAHGTLTIEDSAFVYAKAVAMDSAASYGMPDSEIRITSGGILATENITTRRWDNYLALTNAVLRWTSQNNVSPFMVLGGYEGFSGSNEIQIAVSSRLALGNMSLDLISGLNDPSDTNLFTILFLDTSSGQLYRPEGATYTFETNSATWSITTDGNTEFVPTPPVPILSIDISGEDVNIDARYLLEETTFYLQSSTNLVSGSWSNLYKISGTTSTNWSLPISTKSGVFYRVQSD